tara:strand:- start:120 stop:413 length:294 start_codon:yes stop_codon:yes gene_type:complete
MQNELMHSEMILCRSGYSSIMDLAALGKKAILIPTKGQTEQIYLAKYLMSESYFYSTTETLLNLEKDLVKAKNYKGIPNFNQENNLEEVISDFLTRC